MNKRISLALASLLVFMTSLAQLATGSWKQYPIFGEFTHLQDTPTSVWYVTGGCLYQYDKNADETRFYTSGIDITDSSIKVMRANPDGKFIAVAYANSNIDLVYPDGKCYNLPEIKESIANVDKTINDIRFDGKYMYVVTGFGLVVYDTDRREVKESGNYNKSFDTVIITPNHLYLVESGDTYYAGFPLYRLNRGESIRNFDKFTRLDNKLTYQIIDWQPANNEETLFATLHRMHTVMPRLRAIRLTPEGDFIEENWLIENGGFCYASNFTRDNSGVVRFLSEAGNLCHFNDNGSFSIDATFPESFCGDLISSSDGLKSVWTMGSTGVGNYKINENDGSLTVLSDKSVPDKTITFGEVAQIIPGNDPSHFFIANMGMAKTNPIGDGDRFDIKLFLNRISRDSITDISPYPVTAVTSPGINAQKSKGEYILCPTMIAEDPDYPGRLFIGSGTEGVYVVEDGKQIAKFDNTNSPITKLKDYYCGVVHVSIDDAGNLWVTKRAEDDEKMIFMLPAEKRRSRDIANVNINDWKCTNYDEAMKGYDTKLLHCTKSPFMVGISYINPLQIVYTNGTPDNLGDDKSIAFSTFIDQDGKSYDPEIKQCIAEDRRGHIWIGTNNGIFSINNIDRAFDADFTITRIKVPRNDGSNLADYLLESDAITAIAVDSSNRKWIGTNGSGLYLVSEDGDQIISTFTTANSPLPSNVITALYCDPNSNSVFIGTLAGLYEYASTSAPAKPDYSNVYAYPNPVTPDYSGWITITGLMDASLVKIVDSNMNLVNQLTSQGGMAIWDGCNLSGARVRSGVYYVLASKVDNSSISGSTVGDVVTKILVVN